jgi:hypothetical protein
MSDEVTSFAAKQLTNTSEWVPRHGIAFLRQTEIYLVKLGVDQHIIGFQVSVDHLGTLVCRKRRP